MKKVLIFSLAYYPRYVSGAEAAIKEITDRIEDIEFHLITLHFDAADEQEEQVGNVGVYRVGSGSYWGKMLFPVTAALKARALHGTHRFDALWAMMTYMTLPVVFAKLLGVRVPHILTLQDGDPYEKVFGRLRVMPFMPLIDRGFRTAAVVQAISAYLAEWPRKRGSNTRVEIIYNGANPRDIAEEYSAEEVEALKRRLGKQPDEVWLVNTARLEHQKAQDVVIHALPQLPTRVKFLVVGGGSDEVMLKALAKKLGVEHRVLFTGPVDRSQVTLYRKTADIFAAPSRSEGLGNAFLSAMASRLPVIATQEGGLAEFVFDGETAWVVEKDSPEQIARAVEDILQNPLKVHEITERARQMVLKKFNWDSVAKDMRQKVFGRVLQ